MIRLPIWILMWVVQLAFKLPMWALGFIAMRFMYKKRYTPLGQLKWYQKLFANPEDWHDGFLQYDGSVPPWFKKRYAEKSEFYQFYRYHAVRNPADGLRNIKWLQLWIVPEKVRFKTNLYLEHYEPWFVDVPGVYWYIAWQGAHAGLKVLWIEKDKYTEFKFGFRVTPHDTEGLKETSARRFLGASMASKLRWRRPLRR